MKLPPITYGDQIVIVVRTDEYITFAIQERVGGGDDVLAAFTLHENEAHRLSEILSDVLERRCTRGSTHGVSLGGPPLPHQLMKNR